jgi:hypothetical protein
VIVAVLRLALTPCTVLLASLVQRRLGPTIGGRVVGWPLTTGPFILLLALQSGTAVATRGAEGTIAGQLSVVGFCLAYGHLSRVVGPAPALAGAFAAVGVGVGVCALIANLWVVVLIVLAAIGLGLATWPVSDTAARPARTPRPWETPVRMAVSGALVASLLGLARVLGPHFAGVLATMPVILTVLAPTTHHHDGAAAARDLIRGALASMLSSVVFVAVLAAALVPVGLAGAFGLAVLALLVTDVGQTVLSGLTARVVRTR